MSDIFISYASEDRAETEKLAHAMESHGWSVWWDRTITVGKSFGIVIEEALDEAQCVVVIWSKHSVKSEWVRAEADEAKRQGKLIPLKIDGSNPPLVYRGLQMADFASWTGETAATAFKQLSTAIQGYIGSLEQGLHSANSGSPDNSSQKVANDQCSIGKKKPGTKKTHLNKHSFQEPEMIRIRGGKFLMGPPESEQGLFNNEQQHEVVVDDFAIGIYPVTFAEYDRYCKETGRSKPGDKDWGRDNRPVINVSWEDAYDYAQWLAKLTNKPYRLPTEAEWEYAARGGTQTAYWWGDEFEEGRINCASIHGKTTPVDTFKPNPFGLYDMLGNVREWTGSLYRKDYGGSEQKCSEQESSGDRVIRGGSWSNFPGLARSATRIRGNFIGFRLALD